MSARPSLPLPIMIIFKDNTGLTRGKKKLQIYSKNCYTLLIHYFFCKECVILTLFLLKLHSTNSDIQTATVEPTNCKFMHSQKVGSVLSMQGTGFFFFFGFYCCFLLCLSGIWRHLSWTGRCAQIRSKVSILF